MDEKDVDRRGLLTLAGGIAVAAAAGSTGWIGMVSAQYDQATGWVEKHRPALLNA
jgi:hypothetical protein